MNCFALLTLAALTLVNVHSHDLYILHSPDTVKLKHSGPLRATELTDIITSILGLTIPNGEEAWNKIYLTSIFKLPEAVVVLEIPGKKNPGFDLNKIDHHNLILDKSLEDISLTIERRLQDMYIQRGYSVMHGSLSDQEFLKAHLFHPDFKLNPSIISIDIDSDGDKYSVFTNEIYNLQQLGKGIKEKSLQNYVQDFHWFQLQGIKALTTLYEPNSKEMIYGEEVLNEAISTLIQSYKEIYDNRVFVIAITNDGNESHRSKRELTDIEKELNVAEPVSSDYPVIFNLLLWFCVIFVFSLLAISLSIAQMDPGRDSIIYRMTSNRMKKEN